MFIGRSSSTAPLAGSVVHFSCCSLVSFFHLYAMMYACVHHRRSRCSRPEVFYKKGVLKNFTKFTGKHLCQSLFFNKVARLRPSTLLKKKLWYRCFPVRFVKFLRKPFLQNTSGQPLLYLGVSELEQLQHQARYSQRNKD